MGKPTGFMEYARLDDAERAPDLRIGDFAEFHTPLDTEQRREQAARCMDCGVPFCQAGIVIDGKTYGCPLANLIPEWNDSLHAGKWEAALDRLLKTNNFPEFTGRVCPALCESACICGMHSDPVASKANELSIVEWAFENHLMEPRIPSHRSGKRIAVVGSGPAGLAAADCLNQRGHSVSVFEKEAHPGGLLMYGIPEMKLPKSVIFRRIDLMTAEGIEFITGCEVGVDVEASALISDYDAVVLCCGASLPRYMSFKGDCDCLSGITYASDYLKAATEETLNRTPNSLSARNKRVAVIGAGNTATDCVAVALRQGCKEVIQLVRRPKSDYEEPISLFAAESDKAYVSDYGHEEALARFGHDPRIHERVVDELLIDDTGELIGIHTKPPAQNDTGEAGKTYDVDLLIVASGFSGCDPDILDAFDLDADENGNVKAQGFRIPDSPLFVAGDMKRGQSLVVWAISEGRKAAREVDLFLMGYSNMR